eukprot:TRINITY_DN450_c0_g3_i2.p1 TRINITY_DN450_c0_g3~~TRINITY_DN450_c0_g3_i2.p1  ORF type:complete len:246 (-),score=52.82 TRINITY_DN450_c0_g3_i2:99-836(-)
MCIRDRYQRRVHGESISKNSVKFEMSLTIYGDLMSQPTRAVVAFCELANIEYEFEEIRVLRGEQQTREYTQVNPSQRVPAIKDGDLSMFESHAILRYLARSRKVEDHWYPEKDAKRCAYIDNYLDWHHQNTRLGSSIVFAKVFAEALGVEVTFDVEAQERNFHKSMKILEEYWIRDKQFIAGEQISIADLSLTCELIQLLFVNFDFTKYPKVRTYILNMLNIPQIKKVHTAFFKVLERRLPEAKL